jgi:hypothetical protein
VDPLTLQLDLKLDGVADLLEVRGLAFEVGEERLHRCLVGRHTGPAEVLHDRAQRHVLRGRTGRHLGPIV